MAIATHTDNQTCSAYAYALRNKVYADAYDLRSPVDLYGTPIDHPSRNRRADAPVVASVSPKPETAGDGNGTPRQPSKTLAPSPAPQRSPGAGCISPTSNGGPHQGPWTIRSKVGVPAIVSFAGLAAYLMYACLQGALFAGHTAGSTDMLDDAPSVAHETGNRIAERIAAEFDDGSAAQRTPPLDQANNLEPYAFTAGRNAAWHLQKSYSDPVAATPFNDLDQLDLPAVYHSHQLDLRRVIMDELANSPEHRDIVRLLYEDAVEGSQLTQKEQAERLGVSERTFRRALEKLRERANNRYELYRGTAIDPTTQLRRRNEGWHEQNHALAA